MQYNQKTVTVTAEVFKWGMEDGMKRYNFIIEKEVNPFHKHLNSTKYPGYLAIYDEFLDTRGFSANDGYTPYIKTPQDITASVYETDYIVTKSDNTREVCTAKQFHDTYETKLPENYHFVVNIGDWSKDGHNQHEGTNIKSSHPVEQVQDAFISAAKRLGLLTSEDFPRFALCDEYGDNKIYHTEILVQAGIAIDDLIEDRYLIDGSISMVHLVMRIAKLDLPEFEYEPVPSQLIHFNGFWDSKLNVSIGYGLFE